MASNPKPERRLYRCHPSVWRRWRAWAHLEAIPWGLVNEVMESFNYYRAYGKNSPYVCARRALYLWDI